MRCGTLGPILVLAGGKKGITLVCELYRAVRSRLHDDATKHVSNPISHYRLGIIYYALLSSVALLRKARSIRPNLT